MTMPNSRLALRLLAYADSRGAGEALIGDLLEEMARGRSHWWVCHQLIGLSGVALTEHLRHRARLTPLLVAIVLGVTLIAGVSVAPAGQVLVAWLGFYYVSGTVSLFALMVSRAVGSRAPGIAEVEAPNVG
jgi:hypothetical protein